MESAKGFCWSRDRNYRTLLYNIKVPFLGTRGNSVDMCLFNCSFNQFSSEILNTPVSYIALGELKGGIDPAGADEHWKTANSALSRIRQKFHEHDLSPHLFFVGAAIENAMANELWDQLQTNKLENVANLTNDTHLSSLCGWLCNI